MGDARFFEDFAVGDSFAFGSRTVTASEIVEFATLFDPQPRHVEDDAVASDWHTAALTSQMLSRVYREFAFAGGRGIDEMRWPTPVRPGDTLSGETAVIRKDPVNDERGDLDFRTTVENQSGETVFSLVNLQMMERR